MKEKVYRITYGLNQASIMGNIWSHPAISYTYR
jgi:hypothetical protein